MFPRNSGKADWIQLDRQFFPVTATNDSRIPEDFAAEFFRLSKQGKTWEDLLGLSCVVVLGEAGSGKTMELRARARALQDAGKAAFFLAVEDVANQGIQQSLARDDRQRFERWRNDAHAEAWFMLDSVDEALLNGKSLEQAVRKFEQELDTGVTRAHLVVSSRASDWRSVDEQAVQSCAEYLGPSPLQKGAKRSPPTIVQLAPLDETQILTLAKHHHVTDPDAFLRDVRAGNGWLFLERPRDVEWVVRYWDDHRRLGKLRELIDYSIDQRLTEKGRRKSILSPEEAREAARTLALVACLTQNGSFRLPDDIVDPKAQEALDPREVFRDFTAEKLGDLLTRGLFDEATYGRVRIHHRSVREFLAAEKLAQLVDRGLPKKDLERLLFRRSSGKNVVPPHLGPVVAWLSLMNQDVCRRTMDIAPEHLIDEGDPASLSQDIRREILRAYAQRFHDDERVFHSMDSHGLRRFACDELSETIRELLADHTNPDHLRRTLLRLVEKGKLAAVADIALGIALADATRTEMRITAIRSVVAAGTVGHRAKLATLANQPAAQDRDVLGELLGALFPTEIPVSSVVQLLIATTPASYLTVTNLQVILPRLPERCTQAERLELLADLRDATQKSESLSKANALEVRHDRVWLTECLCELVARVIEDGAPCDSLLLDALELLADAATHPERPPEVRIDTILSRYPRIRREIFWRQVSRLSNDNTFPRYAWQMFHLREWLPTLEDKDWVWRDCMDRPDIRERLLAFDWLRQLLHQSLIADRLEVLSRVALESDKKHRQKGLVRRLNRMQNPPHYEPSETHNRILRRNKLIERRKVENHRQSHEALRACLDEIRSGDELGALWYLYVNHQRHIPDSSAFRKAIADQYDDEIAVAALFGLRAIWRLREPVRLEEYEKNNTPGSCMLALAGLALEHAAGVDIATLPEPLMRKAIGYAMWELNDFPVWFWPCVKGHPDLVGELFAPTLKADYDELPQEGVLNLGRLLYKLPSAPLELRQACAPCLVALLRDHDAPDVQVLSRVLQVLRSSDMLNVGDFTDLARVRILEAKNEHERIVTWWTLWLSWDADEAITFLENWFTAADAAKRLAEEFFLQLWRGQDELTPAEWLQSLTDRQALLRLIPLVPAQMHSPEPHASKWVGLANRHKTQQTRNVTDEIRSVLIHRLAQIDGPETVDALKALAENPQLPRTLLLELAEQRILSNVALERMDTREAVRLVRERVVEPRTTEELFEIALNRLSDIQHHLNHGDFAFKETFNPHSGPIAEAPVQKYLAYEFENRAREQYVVVREPEVVLENKPDIRLLHAKCSGPVTIEVKIAERWSYTQMANALKLQLVDKYMKANNSQYGILVLCSSGPPSGWRDEANQPIKDITELVRRLVDRTTDVMASNRHIRGLRVVSIDFH